MNRKLNLLILTVITTALLTGLYTTNVPTIFADSRILRQDTKQNANCDTVGADSTVSESCNQRAANNVNNGVPRHSGAAGPTTGILRIACGSSGGLACPGIIHITGNNPQESTISCIVCFVDIIIGPGPFTVTAENVLGVPTISFLGDCNPTSTGSFQATGNIAAGQFLTCNINAG